MNIRSPIIINRCPITHIYGYVYLTTCIENNKRYIGQHKWSHEYIDETYIGSGKIMLRAIEKYGKNSFKCEILNYARTQDELNKLEEYYVNLYDAVNSPDFYNLVKGGIYRVNEFHHSKSVAQRISESLKGRPSPMKGRKQTKKFMEYITQTHGPLSEETKMKISKSQMGEKNHMFGKIGSLNPISVPVVKLSMSGHYLETFESENLAGASVNEDSQIGSIGIRNCCIKKWFQYKGFRWVFKDDYYSKPSEYWIELFENISVGMRCKQVVMLSLSGEFERKYNAIKDAQVDGFDPDYISRCCKGKKEKYKNHRWMYLEDFNKERNKEYVYK